MFVFLLPSATGSNLTEKPQIVIDVGRNHVTAYSETARRSFIFDRAATVHLSRSDEIRALSCENSTKPSFVILSREPSRPQNMGLGYCGAGHEDYLLLVEVDKDQLVLRDQLLLQSCLNGILIYNDQGGDDPVKLLRHGKGHSFSFRWETDDVDKLRTVTVRSGTFKMTLDPSGEK